MAGVWRQYETWDGTYSFDDLLDAIEMLEVKTENEARAIEAARQSRGEGV